MTMTLEQFRATRREVADLNDVVGLGYDNWSERTPQPGFVYDYEGFPTYIELEPDGRVHLTLMNDSWLEPRDSLCTMEVLLYQFAQSECEPQPIQIPPPTTLSELFYMSLGRTAIAPQLLDVVPLDSVCGRDCAKAIEAGAALRIEAHKALGDRRTADIAHIVEHVCAVFIRG